MERDVIEAKVKNIGSKLLSNSQPVVPLNNELRIMTSLRFNCVGKITRFILGAEVVAGRTNIPRVEIWRPTGDDDEYIRQDFVEVRLSPGNFTSTGLYEYNISGNPLHYRAGDVFAVFQPTMSTSQVILYYTTISDNILSYIRTGSSTFTDLEDLWTVRGQYVLIHPLAGMREH